MNNTIRKTLLIIVSYLLGFMTATAQESHTLSGTIYELLKGKRKALPYATLSLPEYKMGVRSTSDGSYRIKGVPSGKIRVQVSFVGLTPVDTIVTIQGATTLDFVLREDNFRLKEVTVTAEKSEAGQATSSKISRKAIDHLQALSLGDILSLLPGGMVSNPTLSSASQVTLRTALDNNMNALGTSIIQDGAPISNNANMQTMNPVVAGSTAALGGGASPTGGIDTRMLGVDNIESVEVIRGVPSVEYGDLTSGAIVVRSKAGKQPIRFSAKVNPNVYQASVYGGFNLGEKKGALSFSTDYAYNVNDPIQSYLTYRRSMGKVIYSNDFFDGKLSSNTSLNLLYGKDSREMNPDDKTYQRASKGSRMGYTVNTNGTWQFNEGWLKSISYTLAYSDTKKESYYQELFTAANAPYSATTRDGDVLSNIAGERLYDKEGNEITSFPEEGEVFRSYYLPSTYLGRYSIDGREISLYGKIAANFHKRVGGLSNRVMLGADFRLDGNKGAGKTFEQTSVPYRNLSALNATYRPRSYDDIPFMRQIGVYAEDNMHLAIGKSMLKAQLGLRYDHASVVGGILSPRINLGYDLGRGLSIRAAYGRTAKMPTLLYLYPEKAYFEYINLNELAEEKIAEEQRRFITTTRVFDTANPDLKIAQNEKKEMGLDFNHKLFSASATLFTEKLNNGYTMSHLPTTFKPLIFKEYKRDKVGVLALSQENPVLAAYYTPTNNQSIQTNGIEYELNIHRIEAIRTSFSITGAYMLTRYDNKGYYYYDNSGPGGSQRNHVALYSPDMQKHLVSMHNTTFRVTHNIPEIGFVVTLTSQVTWRDTDRYIMGNDSIPIAYISKVDGKMYEYTPEMKDDPEMKKLIRNIDKSKYIDESLPPLVSFNVNLTKEIKDFMRISFFANNFFRSYPLAESKRSPGSKYVRNNNYFYGLEIMLRL